MGFLMRGVGWVKTSFGVGDAEGLLLRERERRYTLKGLKVVSEFRYGHE